MEKRRKPTNEFARECIATALFALMKEMPYQDISITDICNKAGVARTTYYRNYSSKEHVIRDMIERIARRYLQRMQAHTHNARYTDYDSIRLAFVLFRDYSEWIARMYEANITDLLLGALMHFELDMIPLDTADLKERILRQAYAGALCNVCVMWIRDGMREPADVVAGLFYESVAQKLSD